MKLNCKDNCRRLSHIPRNAESIPAEFDASSVLQCASVRNCINTSKGTCMYVVYPPHSLTLHRIIVYSFLET
jgi:hypothetical protein